MKKTFEELMAADMEVGSMFASDKDLENTKFGYAYKRYYKKNFADPFQEYLEKLQEIRINNALENPATNEVLIDRENPRGYKFSKAGLLKCIKEENEFIKENNKKEIDVELFVSPMVPPGLSERQKDMLMGLVYEAKIINNK